MPTVPLPEPTQTGLLYMSLDTGDADRSDWVNLGWVDAGAGFTTTTTVTTTQMSWHTGGYTVRTWGEPDQIRNDLAGPPAHRDHIHWADSRVRITADTVYREQRAAAATRARELLTTLLNPTEQHRLTRHGRIHITGSAGGHYELTTDGYSGNVHRIQPTTDGRERVTRLCAHPPMHTPDGPLPVDDALTAQILALRTDEPAFLTTANVLGHDHRLTGSDRL